MNSSLAVSEVRLALIPMESGQEKLCWEFTGTINEKDFIIYVNAQTGTEEDILMIQHTNEGDIGDVRENFWWICLQTIAQERNIET